MDTTVVVIFAVVYLGMILGGLPGLKLDRTGVALLGAIALVASERITPAAAWNAVDVPTIALLFGLMVVSAQFRLGGFYSHLTRRLAGNLDSPARLLGILMLAAGVLSALLVNDIVCLAMAPIVIDLCGDRRLNPVPYLLGLACASNIGSAATLIGNPQNMLVGQALSLSFSGYLLDGGVVAALALAAAWWVICRAFAGRFEGRASAPPVTAPPFDVWQTLKGVLVLCALVGAFLFTHWPRDVLALGAAGTLLLSRRLASRDFLGLVDWQLLVLFIGLFVVNHALQESGSSALALQELERRGVDLTHPAWLFGVTPVLSNLVSNVPAVMLLLPAATPPIGPPNAGAILAISSTLAGNLLIVGSIANIIVVEQAARLGVRITWREHARVGVSVTLISLAIAAGWLYLRAVLAGHA